MDLKFPGIRPKGLLILALALIAVGIAATIFNYRDSTKHPAYTYERARGDTLTVAVAYSPMSLYRHGDELGGLNYEMMRSLSAMFGFLVKFFPVVDLEDALSDLSNGHYDVLMADIPVFASLREKFRFTVPVYTDHQVLVSLDSTIRSPLGLAGKRVFVAAGSPAVYRLENLAREIGDTIHVEQTHYSAEQLVMLTATGKLPRAVVNEDVARSLLREYPALLISSDISFTQLESWILNRDSVALQQRLDQCIDSFRKTPEYVRIVSRWADEPDSIGFLGRP